jgi:hypothetical protein
MSNVVPITKNSRKFTAIRLGDEIRGLQADLTKQEVLNPAPQVPTQQKFFDELNEASNDFLTNLLELSHAKERAERMWQTTLDGYREELESAAYFALINGVPEEDIYNIDEHTASALDRAIHKVGAQA